VANAAPLDPERLIKILAKQRIRFASIGDVNITYLNFSVGPAELLEFITSHRSRSLPAVTKRAAEQIFLTLGALVYGFESAAANSNSRIVRWQSRVPNNARRADLRMKRVNDLPN